MKFMDFIKVIIVLNVKIFYNNLLKSIYIYLIMNKFVKKVFFIDGLRTPFQASGTGYKNLNCYDLGSIVMSNLKKKIGNEISNDIDYVVMGNVIQDSKTNNIARESMLLSKFNKTIPSYTVNMACISSNKSITEGVNLIQANQAESIISGGVETMSDLPIKLSKPLRLKLFESKKWKSINDKLKGISSIKLKDIGIEVPSITEFSTNETMGYSADKLSEKWNVSREEQDEYAYNSHKYASLAHSSGMLNDVIKFDNLTDNIIKHDTNFNKLKKLKAAFRKNGTITPGNASALTDGSSACLICSEDFKNKHNLKSKSEIIDYIYFGTDPKEELLLGPAYATALLLNRNKLSTKDIDIVEIHEAFAGQVLSNLNALDSESFCKSLSINKIGRFDKEKINSWGGSLSLGHPFGATGVRLLTMASNRLIHYNKEYGLITSCAAGGLGHAMIIKNTYN